MVDLSKIVIIGIAAAIAAAPGMAVENAQGRSLPGVWVQPQGGVVPTKPGFTFTVIPVSYSGSLSGSLSGGRQQRAILSGELVFDVSANLFLNVLIPQIAYKTELSKVSFSSSFYLPVDRRRVAAARVGNVSGKTFISGGLADVWFSPLTVGIHFSENNNLAIDTKIFAPTGAYKVGDWSNLGMNAWTIQPNVAHTYLWKKRGLEVDNHIGFDIFDQNRLIKYTSGTNFHWDGMLFQYFSERAGVGGIISNVTQINKDRGPAADQLNGFQGGAWGAGPIGMYVVKVKDPGLVLQFRWIREFAVTNRLKGNTLLLGLTFQM